jgi:glycosyltransferase involved in cell wall biosynthesis
MIYLISDNSPNEYQLINKFMNTVDLNVTFLKNQSRLGPGVARNKGIEKSFNKYLYFVDCDDYLFDQNSLE